MFYHFEHRRFFDFVFSEEFGKNRRLKNPEPDPEPDDDKNCTENEWHAPAPIKKFVSRDDVERDDNQIRQEQTGRHAKLRPGSDKSAIAMAFRPFHRQQDGSAPFTSYANTLDES